MGKKAKTHKATVKRFKVTGSGKLAHNRQGDNTHLKTNKNKAQKARQKGKSTLSSKNETSKLKSLMRIK